MPENKKLINFVVLFSAITFAVITAVNVMLAATIARIYVRTEQIGKRLDAVSPSDVKATVEAESERILEKVEKEKSVLIPFGVLEENLPSSLVNEIRVRKARISLERVLECLTGEDDGKVGNENSLVVDAEPTG